jgi:hypothetical protein
MKCRLFGEEQSLVQKQLPQGHYLREVRTCCNGSKIPTLDLQGVP